MLVILLLASIDTQSSVHNKSSYTSQLIKGKSRDNLRLLRYLSGIVTCTFKDGTGCCASWSASSGFPGCGGRCGIFPIIFTFYLNNLPSEAFSLMSSISSL